MEKLLLHLVLKIDKNPPEYWEVLENADGETCGESQLKRKPRSYKKYATVTEK